ncbi:unnamed protein product [Urochloa decumbens]|uniref:Uncharacterized protein n=1 Tax=Urochloa decumbens TaxID=240449 RepID=A0ABC9FMZ6_9POAL
MSATITMPPPPPCDGKLTMTIGSYSEAKKLEIGSCYRINHPVDVGGYSWSVALYPDGELTSTGYMSLFLVLVDVRRTAAAGEDEDIRVKFMFVMHEEGGGETPAFTSGDVAATFTRRWTVHGFERFISREHFEKSALSKSDRLAIRCDLTVFPAAGGQPAPSPSGVKAPAPAPASNTPPKPSATKAAPPSSSSRTAPPPASGLLNADLGRLLETKEGADVELEVGGKVFAAHKTVLAARSPVFKEDFFGTAKEKDTGFVRVIGDMHTEAFEALLHYMYTDTLPEMMPKNLREQLLLTLELLVAADRYGMKGLKSLTEDKLCDHVGVSTVLLILEFAEKGQWCKVKKKCLGFIAYGANARAILASNDFENLARSCPSAVKDVITEILDTREARCRHLVSVCFYAFCFLLLFLVFAVFKKL